MVKAYKLVSKNCVNSLWTASFLSTDSESCECPFGCKVRVMLDNHEYIVDEKEYYDKVFTPIEPEVEEIEPIETVIGTPTAHYVSDKINELISAVNSHTKQLKRLEEKC